MAKGSKKVLIENALTQLFGVGYSLRKVNKIPDGEIIPTAVRHFDNHGLQHLGFQTDTVTVNNGYCIADVIVVHTTCTACGMIYYRIEDIVYTQEFAEMQNLNQAPAWHNTVNGLPQNNTLYGHPHNMSAPPQRANW